MTAQAHPAKGREKDKICSRTIPGTGTFSAEQYELINEKIAYDVYEVITSIIDLGRHNPGRGQDDANQHDVMVIDFLDLVNMQAASRSTDEEIQFTPVNHSRDIVTRRTLEKESM